MSRPSPFPIRSPSRTARAPSPSRLPLSPTSPTSTRPLQISRPDSHVQTSSYESYPSSSGPSRPQRSELRNRISEYETSDASYRDSTSTIRSDASLPRTNKPNTPSKARQQHLQSNGSISGEQSMNTALSSVLCAFRTAGARRRAMTDGSDSAEQRDRQTEKKAEMVRQQRIRDRAPGRANGRLAAGDIDAVLDQVKDGWEFIIDPDFNSVDLALQLLEGSGSGKDMDSFKQTKEMLGRALKGSVDSHYQAFAASLPHRAALLNHLTETQTEIQAARTAVLESKDALGSKRADLVQLWSRGQTLDEMLRILDEIEHLRSVPDLLETLISEKRLLQATVLLVRSLKIVNKPDMLEIGAVSDLRSYLNNQETGLREILVDELHSHLYLKSFWCDGRWSAYVPGQTAFPKVEIEGTGSNPFKLSGGSPVSFESCPTRQEQFLAELAIKPNDPPMDLSELNISGPTNTILASGATSVPQNPEADSFAYIEMLIESLAVLGKLGNVLDSVAQRGPTEIFNLVESTITEVEERAEYGRKEPVLTLDRKSEGVFILTFNDSPAGFPNPGKDTLKKPSSLRLAALESSLKMVDHEILKDLFWTLYSKLDAVAQGMRIVYEIANRIGSRRDFKDSSGGKPGSLFPLLEVWAPVQMEVRTLIHDYLLHEGHGTGTGRNPISSINEVLREGKFARDKNKVVFRFADTDTKKTSKALKPYEDGVTRVLNDTMPGLVPSAAGDAVQATLASVGIDDRILGTTDQHHRLLIKPDAFHVSVLFQPTLAFFSRMSQVLPSGVESDRTPGSILNEFVLKVYLPQLEEKVSDLFHQAVTGPEAFQHDPISILLSPEPLVKASTRVMALINSLCTMLCTSPFHRENYSRLILGVIIQFYQRCSDKFQDLVSIHDTAEANLGSTPCLAVQWAQRSELNTCLSELLATCDADTAKQQQLCRQETNLELELLGPRSIRPTELISSVRQLASLASLYRSITWFTAGLNVLKCKPDDTSTAALTPLNLEPLSELTPYTPIQPPPLPSDELKLSLSREMSLRFQALLKTYEQLSCMILTSIRIDIRCRTVSQLHFAMVQGNYAITQETTKPDPLIIDLNTELMKIDDMISTALPERERRLIFMGLGNLMEHIFISNARHLFLPTSFGIRKVMRNILALQQTVKVLTRENQNTEFEKAKRYFFLFYQSPQDMLDSIRKGSRASFTFDEYHTMLNFQCGVNPAEGDAGIAKATDRNYNLYMIDLHGLELESSDS